MNVLLTGASGSLGKEFAKQFKERNIKYYSHSKFKKSEDLSCICDLADPKILSFVQNFIVEHNITCLVNNAAQYLNSDLNEIEDEKIIDLINVNLIAPILLSKYLYSHLLATNQAGKIININSIAGKQPNYLESVYCASKYGLSGFGASLSINQKKSKIQIIDCFIGGMKSEITKNRSNYASLMEPSKISHFIVDLIESKEQYTVSSIDLRNNT